MNITYGWNFFLKCMWVCLRVEHMGQNTFHAFQKPIHLQKSFDAAYFCWFQICPVSKIRKNPGLSYALSTSVPLWAWSHFLSGRRYPNLEKMRPSEIQLSQNGWGWSTLFNSGRPIVSQIHCTHTISLSYMELRVKSFFINWLSRLPQTYSITQHFLWI